MFKIKIRYLIMFIMAFSAVSLFGQKLKSIGINGGYVVPIEDVKNGYSVEARADFGEVLKYVFLFPSIGYWKITDTVNDQDLMRSHLNFGAYFVGYINSKPRGLYGGVGIHYHVIKADKEQQMYVSNSSSVTTETNTKLGLSINLGYLLVFKKISLYLEPGYTYIQGGFSTLQGRLGLNYVF